MSTPAQKPRPVARRTTARLVGTRPTAVSGVGQLEPPGDVERVHRRVVDDHLGDAVVLLDNLDGHGTACSPRSGPDAASESRWELRPARWSGPTRQGASGGAEAVERKRRSGSGRAERRQAGRRHGCVQGPCRRVCPVTQPVYDFSERVVVVTGGSRGVGAGIVTAFAQSGAHVVTCGSARGRGRGRRVHDGRRAQAGRRRTSHRQGGRALRAAGRPGQQRRRAPPMPWPPTMSPRFVEAVVNLNLLAPLWCAQSAHKVMVVQEDGGCIVNIASVSGMRPSPGASAYGAAKAGLINLTATLAVEWAPTVRVNCVSGRAARHRCRRRVLRGDRRDGGGGGHRAARADGHARRRGTGLPVSRQRRCVLRVGANLVVHGGGERPAFLRAQDRSS